MNQGITVLRPVTPIRLRSWPRMTGRIENVRPDNFSGVTGLIQQKDVGRTAKLRLHLAPGGGAAVRIRHSGK
jgi:hypothetical protein